jgi:hypothetical protein
MNELWYVLEGVGRMLLTFVGIPALLYAVCVMLAGGHKKLLAIILKQIEGR